MKTLFSEYGDFQYEYDGNKTILYDDMNFKLDTFDGRLTEEEIELLIEKMY